MTCPNCRGETHRYFGSLVCSAGCGWSQDEATPATCTCGPRASHAVRCERCGLPPGVPEPAAPRVEPRRPQVGDAVAVRVTKHGSWSVDVVAKTDGIAIRVAQEPGWFFPEEAEAFRTWRWPATQGAAVAGPARECPLPCVLPQGHEGLHRLAPPPPASEPPRSYSPLCAGACWPPCTHHGVEVAIFMREDRNRLLVQNADLTAAKAALEVQLRDERTAHEATLGHLRGKQSAYLEADGGLAALEVQLVEAKAESKEAHGLMVAAQELTHGAMDRWQAVRAERDARAALAASGPVKEGE